MLAGFIEVSMVKHQGKAYHEVLPSNWWHLCLHTLSVSPWVCKSLMVTTNLPYHS